MFDRAAAMSGLMHSTETKFLDFVSDANMPRPYSAASLFVFHTLYEGFGIPIIEAQLCGVSVLISNGSSLPEVGDADSAFYVDPQSVENIANGMRAVLLDPTLTKSLIAGGHELAARFVWNKSAEQLNAIVERVIRAD